jgi:hypothetical protein
MDSSEQSSATGRVMKQGRQGRTRVKEKTVKEQEQQRGKRRPIILKSGYNGFWAVKNHGCKNNARKICGGINEVVGWEDFREKEEYCTCDCCCCCCCWESLENKQKAKWGIVVDLVLPGPAQSPNQKSRVSPIKPSNYR